MPFYGVVERFIARLSVCCKYNMNIASLNAGKTSFLDELGDRFRRLEILRCRIVMIMDVFTYQGNRTGQERGISILVLNR